MQKQLSIKPILRPTRKISIDIKPKELISTNTIEDIPIAQISSVNMDKSGQQVNESNAGTVSKKTPTIKPLKLSVSLETVKEELAKNPMKEPSLPKSKWLPDEIWKPTHVCDDYFISTEGRCYSEKVKALKDCKPESTGYISYGLMIKCKKKDFSAHELVMSAFVGPRPAGMQIDHIDRQPINNKLTNLRYVTPSINNFNRTKVTKRGKPTGQYDLSGNLIKRWERAIDIANFYELDLRILTIQIRKNKPYHGYIFKYITTDIEGEDWKDVELKTGKLRVSSHGRIENGYFSPNYGTKRNGYRIVMVGDKTYQIHHLVCERFNGPAPCETAIANHIDENKENNHKDNLAWVMGIRENTEYSMGRNIIQYDTGGNLIARYKSIVRASEATGISCTSIGRSCNMKDPGMFRYEDNLPAKNKNKKGRVVIQSDLENKEIKRFESIATASRELKIAESSMHYHCSNKSIVKGSRFSFSEDV